MTNLPRRDIAISLGNVGRLYFVAISDVDGTRCFSLGTESYGTALDAFIPTLCLPTEETFFWATAKPILDRADSLGINVSKPDQANRELFASSHAAAAVFRHQLEHPGEPMPEKNPVQESKPAPEPEQETVIYTDASRARQGGGKAVYGWLVKPADEKSKTVVFDFKAVNHFETNRLEALGILSAILANGDKKNIVIYSDSITGASIANGIIDDVRNKKPVEDWFIQRHVKRSDLLAALKDTTVDIRWVKGHTGDLWNECIDLIVTTARHHVNNVPTATKEECVVKVNKRVAKLLGRKKFWRSK